MPATRARSRTSSVLNGPPAAVALLGICLLGPLAVGHTHDGTRHTPRADALPPTEPQGGVQTAPVTARAAGSP